MDVTQILCFKDAEVAAKKATAFLADGYKVAKIIRTDIVIFNDFNQPPRLSHSSNPDDWIVLIVTKKQMVVEGPETSTIEVA